MSNGGSQNGSIWKPLLATVIGGVLATGGGVVGQYYTSQFQFDSQLQIQTVQSQRQVFARLMGRKFATQQLYVSRYEALIFSDYHEVRWKRLGGVPGTFDFHEAERWMHRSEDLVFEIVKNNQALNEDLGTIRTVFPETLRLRELVQRIHTLKAIKTSRPSPKASNEELDIWKDNSIKDLLALVEHEYSGPIEELLDYLSDKIP